MIKAGVIDPCQGQRLASRTPLRLLAVMLTPNLVAESKPDSQPAGAGEHGGPGRRWAESTKRRKKLLQCKRLPTLSGRPLLDFKELRDLRSAFPYIATEHFMEQHCRASQYL